jgi:hypothetical protein
MRFPASRGLWAVLATAAVLMALNRAYAQQELQKGAQNPYLKGTEGFYKGPRELTSLALMPCPPENCPLLKFVSLTLSERSKTWSGVRP